MTDPLLCLRCQTVMVKQDSNITMVHGSFSKRSISTWGQIDTWVCPKCYELVLKAVVIK